MEKNYIDNVTVDAQDIEMIDPQNTSLSNQRNEDLAPVKWGIGGIVTIILAHYIFGGDKLSDISIEHLNSKINIKTS